MIKYLSFIVLFSARRQRKASKFAMPRIKRFTFPKLTLPPGLQLSPPCHRWMCSWKSERFVIW